MPFHSAITPGDAPAVATAAAAAILFAVMAGRRIFRKDDVDTARRQTVLNG